MKSFIDEIKILATINGDASLKIVQCVIDGETKKYFKILGFYINNEGEQEYKSFIQINTHFDRSFLP